MADQPSSVLFVCTFNAIRSPMAEALLRDKAAKAGSTLAVASAGVQTQLTDGFAIRVMQDIGLDMSHHEGQPLSDVSLSDYDLVVTMSEPARMFLMHFAAGLEVAIEHWQIDEPGSAEYATAEDQVAKLSSIRDGINSKIAERFTNFT